MEHAQPHLLSQGLHPICRDCQWFRDAVPGLTRGATDRRGRGECRASRAGIPRAHTEGVCAGSMRVALLSTTGRETRNVPTMRECPHGRHRDRSRHITRNSKERTGSLTSRGCSASLQPMVVPPAHRTTMMLEQIRLDWVGRQRQQRARPCPRRARLAMRAVDGARAARGGTLRWPFQVRCSGCCGPACRRVR